MEKKVSKKDNKKKNTKKTNLVNKPIPEPVEEKDKVLLFAIIFLSLLLILVVYKKYFKNNDLSNEIEQNEEVSEVKLDINSDEVKNLYSYVNYIGTNDDYFVKNDRVDILNFDNTEKLILGFNLISNDLKNQLVIPQDIYNNSMLDVLGDITYYPTAFDVCILTEGIYSCYNVTYDETTNNYNLVKNDIPLETCKDGYTKVLLEAKKDDKRITITSGYAYVTDVCSDSITLYESIDKKFILGTISNTNVENNYYNVDISEYSDKLKKVNYVFELGKDNKYHFYKSFVS